MGKRLCLTSFFCRMAGTRISSSSPPWTWPSCKRPRTKSFRKEGRKGDGNFSESISFTSSPAAASGSLDAPEAVIHGLRSDRLFFGPTGSTSSIVGGSAEAGSAPFEGSTAMAVDSLDPYMDFRESMIRAHGVEDWEWLEEMLVWYSRMNARRIHGVIVGAFLDLLLSVAAPRSHLLVLLVLLRSRTGMSHAKQCCTKCRVLIASCEHSPISFSTQKVCLRLLSSMRCWGRPDSIRT
ncbi:atofp18 ofp18 [Musa troglodytarum]|uniref:Transcription repressor n=1 Tax=Musa troglodytarum TaxID=320322 RepID=A0A9E7FNR8_9LILI|nr:atofp18 ofp18 [Musa troglodytarum]